MREIARVFSLKQIGAPRDEAHLYLLLDYDGGLWGESIEHWRRTRWPGLVRFRQQYTTSGEGTVLHRWREPNYVHFDAKFRAFIECAVVEGRSATYENECSSDELVTDSADEDKGDGRAARLSDSGTVLYDDDMSIERFTSASDDCIIVEPPTKRPRRETEQDARGLPWNCALCTFLNGSAVKECVMCGTAHGDVMVWSTSLVCAWLSRTPPFSRYGASLIQKFRAQSVCGRELATLTPFALLRRFDIISYEDRQSMISAINRLMS